jgi:hypothetical protein
MKSALNTSISIWLGIGKKSPSEMATDPLCMMYQPTKGNP